MTPPIYVAIPVYNGADTIRRTLTNIIGQTFEDFTILVYDDGSTDRTAQIVQQVAAREPRVKLIKGGKNVGRGAARNRLLDAAKDGIIAWQDADDMWNPHKLARQLAFWRTWESKGIDPHHAIMISTFRRVTSRGGKQSGSKHTPPENYDEKFVLSDEYINVPFQLQATFGLSAVYLAAGGFDDKLNWCEDIDVALKIISNGSRIVSHRSVDALTSYNHSLSGAKGDVVEKAQNRLIERHRSFAADHGVDLDATFSQASLELLFQDIHEPQELCQGSGITVETLCGDDAERAHLISRNLMLVMKAMADGVSERRSSTSAAARGSGQSPSRPQGAKPGPSAKPAAGPGQGGSKALANGGPKPAGWLPGKQPRQGLGPNAPGKQAPGNRALGKPQAAAGAVPRS